MADLILALDFGGSQLSAATAAPGAPAWRAHRRVLSPPGADAQHDLKTILALGRELLGGEKPTAIGVSFGGPVDYRSGTVLLSHHVPGWEHTPLQAILQAEFGAPAQVDNDANVAALGEHHFGAGRGYQHLCYITVSTGVGGGWILNGQPWRGADGLAGEIGHTVADPTGPVCLCGKRGCVERLASGPYLAEEARALLQQAHQSGEAAPEWGGRLLAQVEGRPARITARHVSAAAHQGDRLAQQVLARAAWALGVGIGNAANLINPQRFILGGGVTKAGEEFWQNVRRAARSTALPQVRVEVVPALLGDDAPLWGAVALATL